MRKRGYAGNLLNVLQVLSLQNKISELTVTATVQTLYAGGHPSTYTILRKLTAGALVPVFTLVFT